MKDHWVKHQHECKHLIPLARQGRPEPRSAYPTGSKQLGPPLRVPTLHCIDAGDAVVPSEESEALADCFHRPARRYHQEKRPP